MSLTRYDVFEFAFPVFIGLMIGVMITLLALAPTLVQYQRMMHSGKPCMSVSDHSFLISGGRITIAPKRSRIQLAFPVNHVWKLAAL